MEALNEHEKIAQLNEQFHELHKDYYDIWKENTLLHFDWWITVLISVGVWMFWITFRKKDSTHRLLYAGASIALIAVILDYAGAALGLWYYRGQFLPSFPGWLPYNVALLPVTTMFLIQIKPQIAPWKKAIFFGLFTAFIGEPIFVWTGFYIETGWKHIYSAPIYIILYLFCDWLTKRPSFNNISN